MERIEDRSKALSYIGIEIAEALRGIPTPVFVEKEVEEKTTIETDVATIEKTAKVAAAVTNEKTETSTTTLNTTEEDNLYIAETRFEVKETLWEKIKKSKFIRSIANLWKIKIVLDIPALPEGKKNG